MHLNGFGGFVIGYFSGIGTAFLFVATTVTILEDMKDLDEFREWKAARDEATIDGTAKDIPAQV